MRVQDVVLHRSPTEDAGDVVATERTPATRKQEPFINKRLSMVVVDLQGPIVTGVLGGD